jgi:hypothetical protein
MNEKNQRRVEILETIAFSLSLIPDVVLECVSDAAKWAAQTIDNNLEEF